MTLASKLLLLAPESDHISKMALYCFNLARFDQDYDVRDRGRLLSTLLSDICPILKEESTSGAEGMGAEELESLAQGTITLRREQIRMILLQGKEPSKEETDPIGESVFAFIYILTDPVSDPTMTLGSMALVTGKFMSESWRIPEWQEEGTESSLRDSPVRVIW
jgi:AP-3 complex subunit beta